VGDHHAPAAVRHENHRAVDGLGLALDRGDLGRAIELGAAHRRHCAHLAAPERQVCSQQRLPVVVHVVAQPGDDQDGG